MATTQIVISEPRQLYFSQTNASICNNILDDERSSGESQTEQKTEEQITVVPDPTESTAVRDLKRQTGDYTVYSYYFKSIGFWPLCWFFSFVTLGPFCDDFGSMDTKLTGEVYC